jgi:serine/threonine protein kinase
MTATTQGLPEDAATEEAPAGELFAQRYRLGPVLGRGGTALVYRAVDERLRRPVALKVFRVDADLGADPVRRFVVEARLLARLHHPGLVEIYDYGHVPQGPYLALELISGPTLDRHVAVGRLPFADTVRIGRAVAATLAYIHAAGVVHRDVKPSNILLDDQGLPRLTDFGVSFAVDAAGTTQAGNVVGTAAYLAPEQVLGNRAGPAADIFALALVLVECLTGQREYPGSPAESAVARLHRLPTVPQGLPRAVSQMLEQMTAWDPAERPDAEECAAAFGRPAPVHRIPALPELAATPFGADDETVWVQPAVARPVSGKGRSGRRLSAALAAAAVLAAAGVAAVASGADAGSPHAQVPAVVAQPQPTRGSGSPAEPSPSQGSSASTRAQSSSSPSAYPAVPTVAPAAAVQDDAEKKTKKNKDDGDDHGHGHGHGH